MISLIERLANDLSFDVDIYLLSESSSSTTALSAATCLEHVVDGVAHLALGPFSTTNEHDVVNNNKRSSGSSDDDVDFSVPFLYSGYSILTKREQKQVDDLFMFLKPFKVLIWIIIVTFAFGSAVALAFLEFNSPFGLKYNSHSN